MHLNEHSKQEQSSCQLLHFLSAFFPKHYPNVCAMAVQIQSVTASPLSK